MRPAEQHRGGRDLLGDVPKRERHDQMAMLEIEPVNAGRTAASPFRLDVRDGHIGGAP
jgi:hypothetical protein